MSDCCFTSGAFTPEDIRLGPLLRGALEAALAEFGVEADVSADGVIYDRTLKGTFPRVGWANDPAIQAEAYVRTHHILAALTGSSADAPGTNHVKALAARAALDFADLRHTEANDVVSGLVEHITLQAALQNASRIVAAEGGFPDQRLMVAWRR